MLVCPPVHSHGDRGILSMPFHMVACARKRWRMCPTRGNGGTASDNRQDLLMYDSSRVRVPFGSSHLLVAVAVNGSSLTQNPLFVQRISTRRHLVFRHKGRPLRLNSLNQHGQVQVDLDALQVSPRARARARSPADDIQIFCKEGHLEKALDVLLRMEQQGSVPSVTMYRSVLKACADRKALAHAKRAHAHLAKHGLESTKFLGEFVVSTMVKCSGLDDALQVFHRLPKRSVFSWTAVIDGYTNRGQGLEALKMYQAMQEQGVRPNSYTFVSLLKACGSIADLQEGKRIHLEVVKYGCEAELFVSNGLVDMYGKCGSIVDAQNVFAALSQRDLVSWNVMLAAFSQDGQAEEALQLYEQMDKEGVSPDGRTFVSVLQACGLLAEKEDFGVVNGVPYKLRSLQKGRALHDDSRRKGYNSHPFVGSSLISMFGKCGSIVDAQMVFDGLSQRDVVVWTAMLTAYVEQGQGDKALEMLEQMLENGVIPNNRTYVSALQACCVLVEKEHGTTVGQSAKSKSLERGKAIHASAQLQGLGSDISVCNMLVTMYGKCGSIVEASKVFHGLSICDVVSWNAMVAAYVENSQVEKALQLYGNMQKHGPSPDTWTFVSILQACRMQAEQCEDSDVNGRFAKLNYLQQGRAIHADSQRKSLNLNLFVANGLINMYGKCGSIVDAQKVFDELACRDVVSWNTMLVTYVENGQGEQALHLYHLMSQEGVSPDDRTFVSALQACGMLAQGEEGLLLEGQSIKVMCLDKGKDIQAAAQRKGHSADTFVGNTLVSMYGKCGSTVDAQIAFDGLFQCDVVSWNAIIGAYLEQREAEKALQMYDQMLGVGVSPNERTFLSLLQVCSQFAENEEHAVMDGESVQLIGLGKAKAVHAYALKNGYNPDIFCGNYLISLYGQCGSILDAQSIFDEFPHRDVVSWNALLVTYVKQGRAQEALQLFEEMREDGASPDRGTFAIALKACCMLAEDEEAVIVNWHLTKWKTLKQVKGIHEEARRKNYDSDIFIGSSLITIYGKCGSIAKAQNVFDGLSHADVVAWTAMLAAYVEQGQAAKALQMYEQMREEGVSPDGVTIVWVVQACSRTGSLVLLQQVHQALTFAGSELSPFLASTLISAYGRCSSMADAQSVFESLPEADVVSWNALISSYARQGDSAASLLCYEKQLLAGVLPDEVTFLSLLAACSHAGLVEDGVEFFESMSRDYGITPKVEHYVSMVDLLGRAGWFTSIKELLSTMPIQPNRAIWLCLLGACKKHGEITLAEQVFNSAVLLEPKHSAPYVLMSSIYYDAGLSSRANEVNELRQKAGAWKEPGQSWVEHEHKLHTFLVGESDTRPQNLGGLLKKVSMEQKMNLPIWRKHIHDNKLQPL